MSHERYDIWEDKNSLYPQWPWRAQMVNYVARFMTQEGAERFVTATKIYREKEGLK